ncbi:MAG TPA: hypothetical protein PKW08_08095 [Flavobacteriaceae bacterium]|nr:hypothetical protein [Flavobacteriaceae bacterium]MCB9213528.1 hypothetical protein [Alteromonas sp.]HPF10754.1 hypothetical protein [Flavobacteriaceae bacterium]HQU21538.1 hypothetical protein [Flavobacteriaceae bacterium]HQU65507.1 hypothetical protein [Flavobacteriaceae bacterium]
MDFEKLFKELKDEVLALVKDKFDKEGQNITQDVSLFFDEAKDKLKRWSELLATGVITKDEYKLLLLSQKDLVIMHTLHKAGVSNIKLGHFKNAVINTVIDKTLAFIGN